MGWVAIALIAFGALLLGLVIGWAVGYDTGWRDGSYRRRVGD